MFCFRHALLLALALAGAFALPGPASAQMPLARLLTIFPPGGRIGTTVEAGLTGLDLDEANRLHFTQPGITAAAKPEPNRFVITIASNTPPGIYEVRVIGRFGVSNPRAFVVGELPETIANPGNNSFASASEVAPGTTVNGTADANAADYFKFAAKMGQRILIESQAKTIDSRMESSLTLYAADGRELERSRLGGMVDFKVPADGQYVLKVHDFLFRGGGEYFYRVTMDTGPHIDFVLPPSGLPGAKSKHTLYGRNLRGSTPAKDVSIDGKPLEQLAVEIEFPKADASAPKPSLLSGPAQAVVDGFDYRLQTPTGVSNPILLSFATGPVIAEQAANDKPEAAQKVALPCEYTGQFYPARDVDWITFDAKKGEVYWVEVISQRLGLPTDPFVLIQRVVMNDKGQPQGLDVLEMYGTDANVGGAEFKTITHDPAARFEVKEDGAYRVRVQDLFNQSESDPRRVYRLSLRRENPDFHLVAIPQAPPPVDKNKKEVLVWTTLVRRGESIPVQVMVLRRDGFGGEIQLAADGLPPGVTCAGARIEAGRNSALLVISAAENAAAWFGSVKIVGKARLGTNEMAREARAGGPLWNVGDYNTEPVAARLDAGLFLAVSDKESAPLTIQAAENKVWEAAAPAKLQIPLKIVRRAEFGEALKFKLVGLSALEKLKELEVAGQAASATLEVDLSQYPLPPGTHTLHLQAETKGKYRDNPEAAAQTEAASKAAEKAAVDLAAEAKRTADALPVATKSAEEAAALAKAVPEKDRSAALANAKAAADARAAVEKTANEVAAKVNAAEARKIAAANEAKAAADLAVAAKKAADALAAAIRPAEEAAVQAKAVADKDEAEAAAKAKVAADAKAAAEKAAVEAAAKAKDAEAKTTAAANEAKAAADLAAEAKKNADALAAAAKAAEDAAAQARALADKGKAAVAATAKAATDAKVAAEKAAADAAAKAKDAEVKTAAAASLAKAAADLAPEARKATDALAAATKTAEDTAAPARAIADKDAAAAAKAKAAAADKAAADKAAANLKDAEARKIAAANAAKAAADKAKPREVTIMVYSAPITISAQPAPKK